MSLRAEQVCVVVACLSLAASQTLVGEEPEEVATPAAGVQLVDGVPAVRMAGPLQKTSGVVTEPLAALALQPEIGAFGEVVDIQPLLEQRSLYNQRRAELGIARAALDASHYEIERLRMLHQKRDYVSARDLQAAESRWLGDQARLQGLEIELRVVRERVLQAWGAPLASWALDGGSETFDRLLRREQALLLITLRAGDELPADVTNVAVGRDDDRARYLPAALVSPAPRTDPSLQGETWFFVADAARLRTGMRVNVAIPLGGEALAGVSVPASAVVWESGAPWVYVQIDTEHFQRRRLDSYRETGTRWFVSGGLQPRESVVVQGAQMLLSEERRWQIPDEDDD